jgi:hypothetical protein
MRDRPRGEIQIWRIRFANETEDNPHAEGLIGSWQVTSEEVLFTGQ